MWTHSNSSPVMLMIYLVLAAHVQACSALPLVCFSVRVPESALIDTVLNPEESATRVSVPLSRLAPVVIWTVPSKADGLQVPNTL